MPIMIQNSLTRKKEEFVPVEPGRVGIYVCGPTVYGHSHVGHAKSYVTFDVIVKWFRASAFDVLYVQNITDVGHLTDDADEGDDKIEKAARFGRVHPLEYVDTYMRSYFSDMEALGIAHPNFYVRATQHIIEQIEQIKRILAAGHAYEVNGNVYFDVSSWPEYGCLSGRRAEELIEGARVDVRSEKKDPRDFALWKSAEGTGHIMRWPSPWGEGYPGWHIECSAMATKYLGGTFDIHGGGMENKFPHHECEIAQARSAGDGDFARYWIHNNMIQVDGQKMGKSLGNAILIKDVLQDYRAQALRLFLLQTHYSRPSNYTKEGMAAAEAGVDRMTQTLARLEEASTSTDGHAAANEALFRAASEADARAKAAMDDDFNTPVALSVLFELVTASNRALAEGALGEAAGAAADVLRRHAGDVLGVLGGENGEGADDGLTERLADFLLDLRSRLRDQKQWDLSDYIRDQLAEMGIEIHDSPDGSTWTRIRESS